MQLHIGWQRSWYFDALRRKVWDYRKFAGRVRPMHAQVTVVKASGYSDLTDLSSFSTLSSSIQAANTVLVTYWATARGRWFF